jgi:dTDP-4-dehydrorhamnose 3,5-epimerase
VVSDIADVFYKQSGYYAGDTERGISYKDPDVGISWPIPVDELIPSDRDTNAPLLREVKDDLPFEYGG